MKKIIVILSATAAALWLLVCLSGCNKTLKNTITTNEVHESKDSVTTEVRLNKDTVHVPGDTVEIYYPVPVECPDAAAPVFTPVKVQSKGKRSSVTVSIDSAGNIKAHSRCNELEIEVLSLDSVTKSQSTTIDSLVHSQTQVQQMRYIPTAYKWAMGFTVSFFIILLIIIFYKLFKLTPYGKVFSF